MVAPDLAKRWKIDAPGTTAADLSSLGHTICARPMHPMGLDTPFTHEAVVSRRGLA